MHKAPAGPDPAADRASDKSPFAPNYPHRAQAQRRDAAPALETAGAASQKNAYRKAASEVPAPPKFLIKGQLASERVNLLGGEGFERQAGVGGLSMKLGVARVADERHRKAELPAAPGQVEQLLL